MAQQLAAALHSARASVTAARRSPGGSARGDRSARDLYSSLTQEDGQDDRPDTAEQPTSPSGTVGRRTTLTGAKLELMLEGSMDMEEELFVDSKEFGMLSGMVITANTVVIGLECQDFTGADWEQTWLNLEMIFAILYVAEITMRVWAYKCVGFFFAEQVSVRGWNWFDFAVTGFGVADVFSSQILNIHIHASAARLLRLLRILRVFRILRFLRDVEYVLVSSLGSVMRVIWLVLMIDYIGAVVITNLLHDSEDKIVAEMFGRLSSSMFYLFEVMVDGMAAMHTSQQSDAPGGLIVITHYTMEVYPQMWVFWIAFVFIGTISLMALVPAITVELNLRDAEIFKEQQKRKAWEKQVDNQRSVLELIFEHVDQDHSNSVSWAEFDKFLSDPSALHKLGLDTKSLTMHKHHGHDEDHDELGEDIKMDMNFLRMEFTRVYDSLAAEGRHELSCEEFVEAFRHMRAKPMDQVVLTLQQEIFNLRTCMLHEHQITRERLEEQNARMEAQMDAIAQLNRRCAAVLAHAELHGFAKVVA